MRRRGKLIRDLGKLFDRYDALLTPVTSIRPFPLEQRFIDQIDGQKLETYIDWVAPTFLFSLWPGPSMSVPKGFGPDGLPNAVQMIGGIAQEKRLFSVAREIL